MTHTSHSAPVAEAPEDRRRPWTRLLGWLAGLSSVADLAVMALLGAVIPPVAAGAVLSLVGVALLRRRPQAGIVLIFAVSALLVLTGAPFALPHVFHPESPIDFGHAVVHLAGRALAAAAAVGAWRSASPLLARRIATLGAGLVATTVVVGAVATMSTTSDAAAPGDVRVPVRDFAFPSEVRVPGGSTLFVDNADLTRHTFTVDGTDVSRDLPPATGVRFGLGLGRGTYRLVCSVPGHESMTATFVVE